MLWGLDGRTELCGVWGRAGRGVLLLGISTWGALSHMLCHMHPVSFHESRWKAETRSLPPVCLRRPFPSEETAENDEDVYRSLEELAE